MQDKPSNLCAIDNAAVEAGLGEVACSLVGIRVPNPDADDRRRDGAESPPASSRPTLLQRR